MCYNCGCGMPDDDHGDPRNLTNKTFEEAGEANDMPGEQAKINTHDLLQEQMKKEGMVSEDV